MFRVPLIAGVAAFRRTTTLEGASYIFDVRWSDRTSSWYLDLFNNEGVAIIQGVRLAVDQPLIAHLRRANGPPGDLMLIAIDGNTIDPTFDDLAVNHVLIYYTKAELDAIETTTTFDVTVT